MKITDETIGAFAEAYRVSVAAHRPGDPPDKTTTAIRAGLEAAAPLIAAQVPPDGDALARARNEGFKNGVDWLTDGIVKALRQLPGAALVLLGDVVAQALAPENGRERSPCPTCSGPIRETVGMVCQSCGTDYAPDTVDAPTRSGHLRLAPAASSGLAGRERSPDSPAGSP